jgi:D-lactate dehydrogenase
MPKSFQISAWLRKISFFAELDDETISLLEKAMTVHALSRGEYLCKEGAPGDRLFILETGSLVVEKKGAGGEALEIARLTVGDVAGAMSLFTKRRRSASLRAETDCRVWVLDHKTFNDLSESHVGLTRAVMSNLSDQLSRGGVLTAKLLSHDMDRRFPVVFFDTKAYTRAVFEAQNQNRYAVSFLEARLSLDTVSLAHGAKAVCVFVNDTVDEPVVEELHAMGVGLIVLRCAGYNNVDLKACARHNIPVLRVPAYSPHAVAEHAAALMMTLNRKVHRAHNRVREGNFSLDGLVGFDIFAKTAGIVGAGKIGRCLIDILLGFGCNILVYDAYRDPALAARERVAYVTLDELFRKSDIISLHAPLLPDTKHLINEDSIKKMKTGVMIINTSRGALIDTKALLEGLKDGKIGYAGLDVYEEEGGYFFEDFSDRVMTDDLLARLTTFNNVIVTSHQAFLTREALVNIADTTLANIEEFIQKGPVGELSNRVRG